MRLRSRIILFVISFFVLCGTGAFFFFKFDASYFHVFRNDDASCANCRSFIRFHFMAYAEKNDGWFPRGGPTPIDSLASVIADVQDVHHYASHARKEDLVNHWEEHRTLSKDFVSYQYNEGLREGDPGDLIVMYYFKPTRWECRTHKKKEPGRPVMRIHGSWEFLSEAEFKKENTRTLDYLKAHGRTEEAK